MQQFIQAEGRGGQATPIICLPTTLPKASLITHEIIAFPHTQPTPHTPTLSQQAHTMTSREKESQAKKQGDPSTTKETPASVMEPVLVCVTSFHPALAEEEDMNAALALTIVDPLSTPICFRLGQRRKQCPLPGGGASIVRPGRGPSAPAAATQAAGGLLDLGKDRGISGQSQRSDTNIIGRAFHLVLQLACRG